MAERVVGWDEKQRLANMTFEKNVCVVILFLIV
jgi:hypothetical protein